MSRPRCVWRDERTAVFVKPSGQSSEGEASALLEQARPALGWPDAKLPHRLDRITRGFLVVARDAATVAWHNEAIRSRLWTKCYIARLHPSGGVALDPSPLLGRHKAYLRREGMRAQVVRSGGDPSFLEVLAVEAAPGRPGEVHAAIRLETGRFHQIRVMLAHLGAPLTSDRAYGDRTPGEPMLEHALLSLPLPSEGDPFERSDVSTRRTLFDAQDPAREPVAVGILEALSAVAGKANATT